MNVREALIKGKERRKVVLEEEYNFTIDAIVEAIGYDKDSITVEKIAKETIEKLESEGCTVTLTSEVHSIYEVKWNKLGLVEEK